MNKLSKKSQRLVNNFDTVAQSWGWNSDQGSPSSAHNAQRNHEAWKLALERHIARLEARVKRYKPTKTAPLPADEYHPNWETCGGTTPEQNEAHFEKGCA